MSELQLSSKFQYQELYIDSSQTDVGESSVTSSKNWPRLNFEDRQLNPAGLKVVGVEVPFVFDTILAQNNHLKLTCLVLGSPVTTDVFITPGNYNVNELIVELELQFNNISAGWVITWNDLTQKLTFEHIGDFTIDFTAIDLLKTNLYKFLGFEKDSVNISSGSTLTSTGIANPSGPFYIYLNSSNMGQEINALVQQNSSNAPATHICRIPLNVQRGSVIYYNDPTPLNFFDFIPGTKFQHIDLYFTIESAYGYQVVDFKGLSFSVKIAMLTYRSGGSSIMARPSNSRFAGA